MMVFINDINLRTIAMKITIHSGSAGAAAIAANDAPLLDSTASAVVGATNVDEKDVRLSLQQQLDNLQQKKQALKQAIALIEEVIFNRTLPLRIITGAIMSAVSIYVVLGLVPDYIQALNQLDASAEPFKALAATLIVQRSGLEQLENQALSNF